MADIEIPDFWNKKHPLSKKSDQLFKQLVPAKGICDSVVGELLRASNRIGYDWYNNGWGANNWSGAVNYIRNNIAELPLSDEEIAKLNTELNYVYEFSHGEPPPHNEARADKAVVTIHEIIVQGILNTSPVDWSPNGVDMFDLQEPGYVHRDDDEDDEDDNEEEEY